MHCSCSQDYTKEESEPYILSEIASADCVVLHADTLVLRSGDADPTTWGLGLPKGCPCTPELVCQARPHLSGNPHGCSSPDFPVQHAYSLNGSSGRLCVVSRPCRTLLPV